MYEVDPPRRIGPEPTRRWMAQRHETALGFARATFSSTVNFGRHKPAVVAPKSTLDVARLEPLPEGIGACPHAGPHHGFCRDQRCVAAWDCLASSEELTGPSAASIDLAVQREAGARVHGKCA